MELSRDSQNRELKLHGTYAFPVYADRKLISSYPTGSFPWHWHDEVEFTLVLSGQIEYRVNDSCYRMTTSQGLFCNSGALHAGRMTGSDCDYISLTFHPRLLAGFEGSAVGAKYVYPLVENQSVSSVLFTTEIAWQAQILRWLTEVFQLTVDKPPLYELTIHRLLLDVWSVLYGNCAEQVHSTPPEDQEKLRRLRVILTFIQKHYSEKLTLEDVARQVGLCRSECCRFFKRQMGLSLFTYILDYRIGRSLAYLKEGCSVADAANAVGFTEPSYYSKVFRERTGRLPSHYRKEASAKEE